MRIIRNLKKAKLRNTVVALGNFDGVHLGHRKILETAAKYAARNGKTSVALTFDPHPQQVVCPERGLRLLTTLPEREGLIDQAGIHCLAVIKFGSAIRKMSYEKFVKKYLIDALDVRMVFVGYDYAFGAGRRGDVSHLRALGKSLGFGISVVGAVSSGRRIVKSRIIRELLSSGKFGEAVRLLGHPYHISGRVVAGVGRGRGMGFPTANLSVDEHKLLPSPGVYAGAVKVGQRKHRCVVNIGSRPTFPRDGSAVEAHIINFKGSVRGKRLNVLLEARFRDEKQFPDVRELKRQIARDVRRASRAIGI
jgi:riboflavin kinase/FMN adenylyltransferase